MERATNKQKQIIHILEHQLIAKGVLDDEGYRLILRGLFDRESSKDLSQAEASILIDQLVKMGGVITWAPKHGGHGLRIPVRKFDEESSIAGLRHEIITLAKERYGEDFDKPLAALCRKFKIDDYRVMDVRHAKAIKETLLRLQAESLYKPKRKRSEEKRERGE